MKLRARAPLPKSLPRPCCPISNIKIQCPHVPQLHDGDHCRVDPVSSSTPRPYHPAVMQRTSRLHHPPLFSLCPQASSPAATPRCHLLLLYTKLSCVLPAVKGGGGGNLDACKVGANRGPVWERMFDQDAVMSSRTARECGCVTVAPV